VNILFLRRYWYRFWYTIEKL